MKNIKKILAIIICLTIVLSTIPISVFAEVGVDVGFGEDVEETETHIDYSYLTVNQYLAKIFTNNDYSGSLNKYGSKNDYPPYALMEEFYLDVNKASRARIVFNEFNAATDYKTTRGLYELLTFDLSSATDEIMKLEDYYTAILLSILDTKMSDDNLIDDLNCKTNKTIFKLTTNISKFLETTSKYDIVDVGGTVGQLQTAQLDDGDFEEILNICIADTDLQELWNLVGKDVGVIKDIFDIGETINDSVKNIADFAQLANLNADTKEVLHQIYLNCPDDNLPMKNAARKVYEYVSGKMSYEIMALSEAGYAACEYLMSEIAGYLWKECLTAVFGELAVGVQIGQAVGKMIANYCFASDAVDEQLCAISALVDFEDVMVASVRSLESVYKADDNIANSDSYVKSLQLLMSTYDLGCDYVEDFVETVYEKGAINNIIYNNSKELQTWRNLFANQKILNEKRRAFLYLDTYKGFYKIDAPSAYEACFGNTGEETGLIPITSINVTQKKDIALGDEGTSYDFFSITYSPDNHTELILGETVSSSDESIIKVDDSGMYIGGYIYAVGEGACTLTFTTYDLKHSVSVEVTVGKNTGAPELKSDWDFGIMRDNDKNLVAYVEAYNGEDTSVIVPSNYDGCPVVAIVGAIFKNNNRVKRVFIPDTVNSISSSCFKGCSSLEYVSLPSELTEIKSDMFFGCSSLKNITIPNNVTSIQANAFAECINLNEVNLSGNISQIGEGAFYNCKNIISDIVFTDKIKTISRQAFYGCEKIKKIVIPDNVTEIKDGTFYKCSSLSSVVLPAELEVIGGAAFGECESLVTLTIPDRVKSIGEGAFYNCSRLNQIIIPNGVTYISCLTFANCINLTDVIIPDSVRRIDYGAFKNCSGIKKLTIPCSARVEDPKDGGSASIDTFYFPAEEEIFDEVPFSGNAQIDTLTITVGDGIMPEYELYSDRNEITCIGVLPWHGGNTVKEIVIQDGVKNISAYAFWNTDVEKIHISDTVSSIGESSFGNCKYLRKVELPNTLTTIGKYAFSGCSNLETVTIPDSLVNSNNYAFIDCTNLKQVNYNGTLAQWCNIDFGNRYGGNPNEYAHCLYINGEEVKGNLIIPDGVKIINNNTFAGCRSITSVEMPEGITEIRYGAFDDCTGLRHIVFPDSLENIGAYAFEYCNFLYLNVGSNLHTIEHFAFWDSHIQHIYYRGNESQWNEISGNTNLLDSSNKIDYNATCEDKLEYNNTVKPGCTTQGYDVYKCTLCLEEVCTDYVEPLGHSDLTIVETVPATCITKGYTVYKCNICDEEYQDDFVDELGIDNHKYVNGICTICKDGIAEDLGFEFDDGCILGYYGNASEVTIPRTINGVMVHSICKNAFSDNSNIISVTIPDSVTSLDAGVFSNCINLKSVKLSNSIKVIKGNYADGGTFENCTALEEIIIPDSIVEIEHYAFKGCSSLSKVFVSENSQLKYVEDEAFLETAWIDNRLNYVDGFLMLNNCLIKVNSNYRGVCYLPDGITYIPQGAFDYCEKITAVIIPEGVTDIEYQAFFGCMNLVVIYFPVSLKKVENHNFGFCDDLWHVLYAGTSEQWLEVEIYSGGNDELLYTPRHYNVTNEAVTYDYMKELGCLEYGSLVYNCAVCNEQKEGFLGHDIVEGICINCGLPEDCCIESEHYQSGCSESWTIARPGAKRIAITFNKSTHTAYRDYIYLYDANDNQIGKYKGTDLAGKRIIVKGDTVKISFESNSYSGDYGFALSNVEVYYEDCQHTHTEIRGAREATCGTTGSTGAIYCVDCDEKITEETIIPATELHEMTENVIEPSCTTAGYTEQRCSVCGYSYITDSMPALGHSGVFVETVSPDCTNQGYDVYHCSVCNKDYSANYTDPLGHTPVIKNIIEPTCFKGGHTEYCCSVCGYEWNDDIVTAVGHTFKDGICESCGMLEEDCLESEHNYPNNMDQSWIISKPHAESISITFSSNTYTESGWDYIYIYDSNDNLIGQYSGSELSMKTITVDGNLVRVRMTSDGSVNGYGFALVNVEATYPPIIEGVIIDGEIGEPESQLYVDKHDSSEIVFDFLQELKDDYNVDSALIYDIYLEKGGERIQPAGEVAISIPVPEIMNGELCQVFYIDDFGAATDMNAVYENGYMIFTTDYFSYYAVVEKKPSYILGDVNGDTSVDSDDAVYLLYHTLLPDDYPINQGGDFNGDGEVNSDDAIYLLYYTLLPDSYPLQ